MKTLPQCWVIILDQTEPVCYITIMILKLRGEFDFCVYLYVCVCVCLFLDQITSYEVHFYWQPHLKQPNTMWKKSELICLLLFTQYTYNKDPISAIDSLKIGHKLNHIYKELNKTCFLLDRCKPSFRYIREMKIGVVKTEHCCSVREIPLAVCYEIAWRCQDSSIPLSKIKIKSGKKQWNSKSISCQSNKGFAAHGLHNARIIT